MPWSQSGSAQAANRNLVANAVIWSGTPSSTYDSMCVLSFVLGNGTNNLSGDGGEYLLTITVGGVIWFGEACPFTLGTTPRQYHVTSAFPVPAGTSVSVLLASPNSSETAVHVTARMFVDAATVNANVVKIGGTDVAVDTNTVGQISFVSNAFVATSGGTVNANVVQVGGENIYDDGNGRMEVLDSSGIATLLDKLDGMTSLPQWLRVLARSTGTDSTALSEINSGGGLFAPKHSLEGIRRKQGQGETK